MSCLGRTSERISVLALKPSRNTKKFCVKRPNKHQNHSAGTALLFEGTLQHHMEEVVEGVHQKHSSLEQCNKHKDSIIRVIKSPYLNIPRLLDVDRSKVHPLVRNLFRKTSIFLRKLGKIKSRCEYFVHSAGFQNTFLPNPISVWFSPFSKSESRGKVTNKIRNKGNVEESAI